MFWLVFLNAFFNTIQILNLCLPCLFFDVGQIFLASSLYFFKVLNVLKDLQPPLPALSCLQAQRKLESQLEISFHKKGFFKLDETSVS